MEIVDSTNQPLMNSPAEPLPALPPKPGPTVVPDAPPPPPQKRRGWMVWAGLAAAAGVGVWLWQNQATTTTGGSAGIANQFVTAETRPFEKRIRIGGTIGAARYTAARAPRMRGREGGGPGGRGSMTISFLAPAGSIVQVGDLIAEFESKSLEERRDDYASNVAQFEARVENVRARQVISKAQDAQKLVTATATKEKADLDVRTAEVRSEIEAEILKLLAQQAEVDLDATAGEVGMQKVAYDAELRIQEIDVEKSRIRLDRYGFDLERMKVRTQVGGLVVHESIYKGGSFEQVRTGDEVRSGQTFLRVVDMSDLRVFGTVNQVDSQSIRMGQKAVVRLDAFPDLELAGRVVSIGALATSDSGGGGPRFSRGGSSDWVKNVAIEVAIEERDENVTPDLSASADVLLTAVEDALQVPRAAVREREDGSAFVWIREGDGIEEREVEIADWNETDAVIASGIEAGDEVVKGQMVARAR